MCDELSEGDSTSITFRHLNNSRLSSYFLLFPPSKDKLEYFAVQKRERIIVPFSVDVSQQEAVSALKELKVTL